MSIAVDHPVKSEPLDPRQYQSGSQSFGRHPENALNRSEGELSMITIWMD